MTARIPPEHADEVGKLYLQVAPALFGYACTLPQVDRARAEDLVQMAFQEAAVCWVRLAALDVEGRRRWLFTVLRNKAIDEWRRNGRVRPHADPAAYGGHPAAEPFTQVLSALVLQRCWSAIERMPPIRQRVAFLRWNEEWSTAEIADWLGIASATVRGHLKVARDELVVQVGSAVPFLNDPEDTGDELGEEAP
ncbi:RNA polymerase sigma factor [Thermomonospora umbrina]|uniref:RNA polymerase sigma-70 factor (ECF subfamily) n=1 Tax=Thermomonospora umbrina TaxID=111806 RepID=A0A3D9SXV3_9ACTN|nr:sigma-70 family RNA polymerase sigma factor [Thermomonospora umbrina]REF00793.1 RNA polymerase sigma-70 factor (ECF subfamily) [Thermomonospora umbrina]